MDDLTPMFLFLFIVQTGLSDPDPVHSPHFGVWWEEVPQPRDSKVEPSFSLYSSPHYPMHGAGDEVHPRTAVHRQDPHAHPPRLGEELTTLEISAERKTRYLEES